MAILWSCGGLQRLGRTAGIKHGEDSGYPPGNQRIAPKETENHLQKFWSKGDMLVPRRVCFKWLQIIDTSILFPGRFFDVFWGKPLYTCLR